MRIGSGRGRSGATFVVALAALLAASKSRAEAGAPTPAPERPHPRRADHVFVLMLDGTRPDALRLAEAPTIHGLEASGTTYVQARTSYPSQTRVSFVTLPTGSWPGSHGIVGGEIFKDASWQSVPTGDDDPIAAQALVARPTMFEEATAAGLTSLYAAMKGYELVGAKGATWTINGKKTLPAEVYKTRYDAEVAGSTDLAAGYKNLMSRELLRQVLEIFKDKRPNILVINLGSADYTAHTYGPFDPHYLRSLAYIDGVVAELLSTLEAMGLRERSTFVISADHGFSSVDSRHVLSPSSDQGGHQLEALTRAGIEHYMANTGGTSIGVYVRDHKRVAEAAAVLRAQSWCESLYCEDAKAGCDRTLRELHAYFPGRSPDLMVDVDDDVTVNAPTPGDHGSYRAEDMRIPLVLSGAGIAKGRVLGKAFLVDVAPTVLELLGLPGKVLRPDGHVLTEALAP